MQRTALQQILTSLAIPWKDEGKCVNICCPFDHSRGGKSGQPDTEYRCGIFPEPWEDNPELIFHCFRCKRKGELYDILHTLLGLSLDEYKVLVKMRGRPKEQSASDTVKERLHGFIKKDKTTKRIELPKCHKIEGELVGRHPLLKKFLYDRKISIKTCEDYDARYTGNIGEHAHKLIIPIYSGLDLVAWQGRDISGRAKSKYFTCGNIMQYLYWTTEVWFNDPRIYLVEGILDAWRMDHNAVACFSHALTQQQRVKLLGIRDSLVNTFKTDDDRFSDIVDELVIAFDSDSYQLALKLARDIRPIIDRVGVVRLPDGEDPDSFGEDEVRKLPVEWV